MGDPANRFAELWRMKQLEYSFRRALMRSYKPFSLCTRQALLYTEKALGVQLTEKSRAEMLSEYTNLPLFPEVASGLESLKIGGHSLAAFSNGEAEIVRSLLERAKLLSLLDDIVSADEIKTFKPDPLLYAHAVKRLGQRRDEFWLVSSNPFDIIGAKTAGLHVAWVQRTAAAIFDPWEVEPDCVASGIDQLAL